MNRIEKINVLAVQIKEKEANVVEIAAQMGILLHEQQEELKKREFVEWVETNFKFSVAWAYRCMRIGKHIGEISTRVEFIESPTLAVAYKISGEIENKGKEPKKEDTTKKRLNSLYKYISTISQKVNELEGIEPYEIEKHNIMFYAKEILEFLSGQEVQVEGYDLSAIREEPKQVKVRGRKQIDCHVLEAEREKIKTVATAAAYRIKERYKTVEEYRENGKKTARKILPYSLLQDNHVRVFNEYLEYLVFDIPYADANDLFTSEDLKQDVA